MRWLILVIGLALLPLFSLWQKSHYEANLKSTLQTQIQTTLNTASLPEVTASLDHLDARLEGTVNTLQAREQARSLVDALPGARAREADNHIRVYPQLQLSRSAGQLLAKGWLYAGDHAALQGIGVQDGEMRLDDAVLALDDSQRAFLLKLIGEFFALPGERSLRLDMKRLLLSGDVTLMQLNDWQQASQGWFDPKDKDHRLTLYPSLFHFPGYRTQTAVTDSEQGKALLAGLQQNPIFFAVGSAEIAEAEQGKIGQLAAVIQQAEAQTQFVVGGHTDASGTLQANMALGKARAESVINALVALGIGQGRFQVQSFGPSQLAGDNETEEGRQRSRRVEILIK